MLLARKGNEIWRLWRLCTMKAATGLRRGEASRPVLMAAEPGIGLSPARRMLDIAVAVVMLCLVSPLLLALSVGSRLSTGGSAIYRQRRVGQGGVPFTLLKFRSMRTGGAGPEVTVPGDDRVTRLGAFMRKTSMDELPQLVNVLLGQMTLVGPRPETVALAKRYPEWLQFVFRYRPGMTGPSQVLARDEKVLSRVADVEDFYLTELVPHRVALDLDYLQNPTLARTVRWLIETTLYLVRTAQPRPADAVPALTGAALGASPDE
jgi:lipopolysaccharide/colanic/teichoic acid biosynthesis glycosyltransferase